MAKANQDEQRTPSERFQRFLAEGRFRLRLDEPPILTITWRDDHLVPTSQWCITVIQVDEQGCPIDGPVIHFAMQFDEAPDENSHDLLDTIFSNIHFSMHTLWNAQKNRCYSFRTWYNRAHEQGLRDEVSGDLEWLYQKESHWVMQARAALSRSLWKTLFDLEYW